jgi:hypothetical protein
MPKDKKWMMSIIVPVLLMFGDAQAYSPHKTQKIFVANNAIDSETCGMRREPCRSISKAIENASDGATIVVGPGRYGDLNGDGDFDDPGEEAAQVGFGCRCMILVDKQITIQSRAGAEATILDASGATVDVVNIVADGVVFGGKHAGFTLTGARMMGDDDGIGLAVITSHGVHIIGNTVEDNEANGFEFSGDKHRVVSNIASRNGNGFSTAFTENGHTMHDNIAIGNGNASVAGNGFSLTGNRHTFSKNSSTGNRGIGVLINSTDASGFSFQKNSIVGNIGSGIFVFSGPGLALNKNNIFGNFGERPFFPFTPTPNCGVVNDSGATIDATRNYWGATSGPGEDPADNAGPGSDCDLSGVTVVEPFARSPFRAHPYYRLGGHSD